MGEITKIILVLGGYSLVGVGVLAIFRSIILGWFKDRVTNEKELFTRMGASEKLLVEHDGKIYFARRDIDEHKQEHKENH